MKDVEAREMFENAKEFEMLDVADLVAHSEQMFSLEKKYFPGQSNLPPACALPHLNQWRTG